MQTMIIQTIFLLHSAGVETFKDSQGILKIYILYIIYNSWQTQCKWFQRGKPRIAFVSLRAGGIGYTVSG